jgi:hypothetical protein
MRPGMDRRIAMIWSVNVSEEYLDEENTHCDTMVRLKKGIAFNKVINRAYLGG